MESFLNKTVAVLIEELKLTEFGRIDIAGYAAGYRSRNQYFWVSSLYDSSVLYETKIQPYHSVLGKTIKELLAPTAQEFLDVSIRSLELAVKTVQQKLELTGVPNIQVEIVKLEP